MRTLRLIAILTCALLVSLSRRRSGGTLKTKNVIESKALATLDEERFECSLSCDIKKNGKPCKGSGEKKCSGGWRCKMNFCLKF
uniref:Omega-Theraphotoxin-Ct1a_5 n=1 Tax=Coremiocnemis tropix TaxID=1904443 RepID=A0A482ZCN6_CORTR